MCCISFQQRLRRLGTRPPKRRGIRQNIGHQPAGNMGFIGSVTNMTRDKTLFAREGVNAVTLVARF